jgi:protein phosphatase
MTELMLEMDFATDTGRKRGHNEDYVDFRVPTEPDVMAQSGRLYIVADGMGGGASGEVASEYAVNKVLYEYYRSPEPDLAQRLRDAIGAANSVVFDRGKVRPELRRMTTTIVAAAVRGDRLVVANVGDSRAYVIRSGEIRQVTPDHTLVEKLVAEGSIAPEEAERHPKRNILARSIGKDPDVDPDVFEARLLPGDQVVLCSDGLTRYVSDEEILAVATRTPTEHAVRQLVHLANERGGKDNISVLLLYATGHGTLADTVGRPVEVRPPVPPEFDSIQDTVKMRRRRRVPAKPRRSRPRSRLRELPRDILRQIQGPRRTVLIAFAAAVPLLIAAMVVVAIWTTIVRPRRDASPGETPTGLAEAATAAPAAATEPSSSTPTSPPSPTATHAATPGQAPTAPGAIGAMTYTIPPGVVLGLVAEWWGIDQDCLVGANEAVEDPNDVWAGTVLRIPGGCLNGRGLAGQVCFVTGPEADPAPYCADIASGSMAQDTGGPAAIPCHTRPHTLPVASPDGEWQATIVSSDPVTPVVFGDLWVSPAGEDPQGAGAVQLTFEECAADPVWSPDGAYIAFASACKVTGEIAGEMVWESLEEARSIWAVLAPSTEIAYDLDPRHFVLLEQTGLAGVTCWQAAE